ncbi:hypothetical protein KJ840_04545 [Patescibacteria group bacterium]|nr:hypothetical protein [Patescibacteria group bacterium]
MIIKQKQKWLKGAGYNLKLIIFSLSIISIVAYLLVVNYTNTLGIEMGEMQWKINQLEKQRRDLQSQATALQSMTRIEEISNLQLSMVMADNFDYLLPEEKTFAARK